MGFTKKTLHCLGCKAKIASGTVCALQAKGGRGLPEARPRVHRARADL